MMENQNATRKREATRQRVRKSRAAARVKRLAKFRANNTLGELYKNVAVQQVFSEVHSDPLATNDCDANEVNLVVETDDITAQSNYTIDMLSDSSAHVSEEHEFDGEDSADELAHTYNCVTAVQCKTCTNVMHVQAPPVLLDAQKTTELLQKIFLKPMQSMEEEIKKLKRAIGRMELQNKTDSSSTVTMVELNLPEGCGDTLPITNLETFEDFDAKLASETDLKTAIGALLDNQIGSQSDKNLVQCVGLLLRKLVSREVATSYNGQTTRMGKKPFNKTTLYKLIKAHIKKIKKFETLSDPEFDRALGRSLTVAAQWKTGCTPSLIPSSGKFSQE